MFSKKLFFINVLTVTVVFFVVYSCTNNKPTANKNSSYSTCSTWKELVENDHLQYATIERISDPGSTENPSYTGFWFYDEFQFDATDRYMLGMKVDFTDRLVREDDIAEIGFFDLKNKNRWTKIGQTTAWNWQQGCRLQWRPNSDEILWNDHSDDKTHFVCRAYNFKTQTLRTLPKMIYDVSSDGKYALLHDFSRMKHAGTSYAGVEDPFKDLKYTSNIYIEKMNLDTGVVEKIIDLEQLAKNAFPQGYDGNTNLYFFREGWNPSGTRFITFLRNMDSPNRHISGWSIDAKGEDIRYFYKNPSHHVWVNDSVIFEGRYFAKIRDDGSGNIQIPLAQVDANIDPTFLPEPYQDWILGDTYVIDGYQHLFLFHQPTKLFVPLARLKNTGAPEGIFRVDLHARSNRSGRKISIDSTHEGLGRQLYLIDIGHILDHPPQ